MERFQSWFDTAKPMIVAFGLKVLGAIAVYIVGRWLIGIASNVIMRALERQKVEPTVIRYIGSVVSVALNIILVVAILGYFGVETTSFAALVAGLGVAIGAAWGGLLSNFAAGAYSSTSGTCSGASRCMSVRSSGSTAPIVRPQTTAPIAMPTSAIGIPSHTGGNTMPGPNETGGAVQNRFTPSAKPVAKSGGAPVSSRRHCRGSGSYSQWEARTRSHHFSAVNMGIKSL